MTTTSAWRARLLGRLDELEFMSHQLQLNPAQRHFADECLSKSRAEANKNNGWRESIVAAWSGGEIDAAWIHAHALEVLLVRAQPAQSTSTVTDVIARSAVSLKADDPHLVELKAAAKKDTLPDGTMALAAETLTAAYAASDEDHRRVRSFRNVLLASTVVLAVFAIGLGVISSLSARAIGLCWTSGTTSFCPTGHAHATGGDVFAVELLGLIGATIVGGIAVRSIRGTSSPYSVPLMSLLIKLPTGALTAVGGLLLTHLITGYTISDTGQLSAYAVLFGASQQLFTRLVDKQAQNVLDSVPTASKDTAKPPAK